MAHVAEKCHSAVSALDSIGLEVYVQRFADQGLHSIEDVSGMSAAALSDDLMKLGVTEVKLHANRMARELVQAWHN